MVRTGQVILNATSNCLRFGIGLVVMFVLTPVIIHRLGQDQFGIWSLVYSVLGFFMLLDFGMDTSVVKWVGHCRGRQDVHRRNRVLSTVAAVYIALALVGMGALLVIGLRFTHVFDLPLNNRRTATVLLMILGARTVLFGLPLSLFRATLFGEQRIWQINLIQAITTALYGAAAVTGLHCGMGLVGLAWLNLAALLIEHAGYLVLVFRYVDGLRLSFKLVDPATLREVAAFSAYQFIINVSGMVLLKLDPVLVSLYLPLSAVAVYAVALKIAENLHLLAKQSINVLAPLVAQLDGEAAGDKIRLILVHATRYVFAGSAILVGCLGAVAGKAVVCWVGPALADAGLILIILAGALAMSLPQITASTVLAMTGHHRTVAAAAMLRILINIIASLVLVKPMGLAGIATGTLVATLAVDWGFVLPIACRLHRVRGWEYARSVVWPAVLPMATAYLGCRGLMAWISQDSLTFIFAQAAGAGLLATGVFAIVGLNASEKASLRRWATRSLQRFAARSTVEKGVAA